MEISIRPATPTDAAAIAAVQVGSWRATYSSILPEAAFTQMTIPSRTIRWQDILTTSPSRTWVAESPTGVIGFASGGKAQEPVAEYNAGLLAIYLDDNMHHHGVGRRLVQTVAQYLRDSGYNNMLVWALQQNPAIGFYKRLGASVIDGKMIKLGEAAVPELALGWGSLDQLI